MRLWVGRRKEPILGYVRKTTKERIQASMGWSKWIFTNLFNPLLPNGNISSLSAKMLILIFKKGSSKNFSMSVAPMSR